MGSEEKRRPTTSPGTSSRRGAVESLESREAQSRSCAARRNSWRVWYSAAKLPFIRYNQQNSETEHCPHSAVLAVFPIWSRKKLLLPSATISSPLFGICKAQRLNASKNLCKDQELSIQENSTTILGPMSNMCIAEQEAMALRIKSLKQNRSAVSA